MDGDWLELDDAPLAALPAWAAEATGRRESRVVVSEHGIAVVGRRRGSVAPWDRVLEVALVDHDEDAYLLVPRRPPRPPWSVVPAAALPGEQGGLEGFVKRVRERIRAHGYRHQARRLPQVPAAELLRRVLAREAIAGAVEVPIGPGPLEQGQSRWLARSVFAGLSGSAVGSAVGFGVLGAWLGPVGILAGGVIGGVAATATTALISTRKSKLRVLVLSPDGCVVGFEDGPRGFSWEEIGDFRQGTYDSPVDVSLSHRPCLDLLAPAGGRLGRIDAAWFEAPLPLIVAVAEAYRRRATRP